MLMGEKDPIVNTVNTKKMLQAKWNMWKMFERKNFSFETFKGVDHMYTKEMFIRV